MLSAAQTHLQKVAIAFLIGFLGSFYALWLYVWDRLKTDLFAKLPPGVAEETSVIAPTPFAVPLLQAKIALVVGGLVALPVLLYYSRGALRERGYWVTIGSRWTIAAIGLIAVALFAGGVAYGYFVFFPLMFAFLAELSVRAGFQPTYSIVLWAQFVFLLMLSFGLAAQLPLAMTGLSLSHIVPYETWREKWKYAIIGAFGFGALFSPPDPFTQVLWAVPIITLYALSLGLTKVVVTIQRGGSAVDAGRVLRERWRAILAAPTIVTGVVAALIVAGFGGFVNQTVVPAIPYVSPAEPVFKYIGPVLGLPRDLAIAVVAGAVFVVVLVLAFAYALYRAADAAVADGRAGDPTAIDLASLDAAGVRAAPTEAFRDLSEQEAVAQASMATSDDEPEKARAILDRFDEAAAAAEAEAEAGDAGTAGASDPALDEADHPGEPGSAPDAGDDSNPLMSRTAGVMDTFTTEETTEEDVGGYYYDIAFVLDSLRSRAFLLLAIFMAVLAGTFLWFLGNLPGQSAPGIDQIRTDFLGRLPATVRPEQVGIVELHPTEALVFAIKLSTLFAALAVLPLLLYYAWPALRERGITAGDRRVLVVWAGALFVSVVGGIAAGYTTIAPAVVSWLAADAIGAGMVVSYRISAAGWLVFFTTVGIGLLALVPVTMVLFHRGGLIPYRGMRNRWREVTVGVFAITAYISPRGVFMMFILGIPLMLCYGLGLGLLWLYTLGGRRAAWGQESGESAD